MEQNLPQEIRAFLRDHPDVRHLETLLVDVNGIVRGKRIGIDEAPALFGRGLNLPGSLHLLAMRGRNIEGLGIGTDDGDPDMLARPVPGARSHLRPGARSRWPSACSPCTRLAASPSSPTADTC